MWNGYLCRLADNLCCYDQSVFYWYQLQLWGQCIRSLLVSSNSSVSRQTKLIDTVPIFNFNVEILRHWFTWKEFTYHRRCRCDIVLRIFYFELMTWPKLVRNVIFLKSLLFTRNVSPSNPYTIILILWETSIQNVWLGLGHKFTLAVHLGPISITELIPKSLDPSWFLTETLYIYVKNQS